jgi:hypothetical protein
MTGDVHVETRQDVEASLDWSKRLQNDAEYSRQGMKQEMWHYSHIPLLVQVKWLNEYGLKNWPMKPENKELLFRLLNSPEYAYLKTTQKIHIARS